MYSHLMHTNYRSFAVIKPIKFTIFQTPSSSIFHSSLFSFCQHPWARAKRTCDLKLNFENVICLLSTSITFHSFCNNVQPQTHTHFMCTFVTEAKSWSIIWTRQAPAINRRAEMHFHVLLCAGGGGGLIYSICGLTLTLSTDLFPYGTV